VVFGADGEVDAAHGSPGLTQTVEGLGTGDFVNEVEVDVDEVGLTVFTFFDQVISPDLFGQGFRCRISHCPQCPR